MENAEANAPLPLSIRMLSSGVNVEEQTQNETNQNSIMETSDLAQIQYRIQQLQGRHLLLQKTLSCTKKDEPIGEGSSMEPASEDGEQLGELEAIQKELQELQTIKDNMVERGAHFIARENRGLQLSNHIYRVSPRGGIYTLPPPDLPLEGTAVQNGEHQIIPVESLGYKPAATKCPSCQALIVTQTQIKVGISSFVVCFVCSMLGCVAGCCLIPFFTNRFKNVHHYCPRCQTHIHTFMPV